MNQRQWPSLAAAYCLLAVALFLLSACSSRALGADGAQASDGQASDGQAAQLAFRSSVDVPPKGWDGPVFALSHDYPAADPGVCPTDECTWLGLDVDFSVDFTAERPTWEDPLWNQYIQAILDYVAAGQDADLADAVGFQAEVDGATRWYHVPWMAYNPQVGREFVHGTTNERTAHLSDLFGDPRGFGLHSLQHVPPECEALNKQGFETWAVGMPVQNSIWNTMGSQAELWNAATQKMKPAPQLNGGFTTGDYLGHYLDSGRHRGRDQDALPAVDR